MNCVKIEVVTTLRADVTAVQVHPINENKLKVITTNVPFIFRLSW